MEVANRPKVVKYILKIFPKQWRHDWGGFLLVSYIELPLQIRISHRRPKPTWWLAGRCRSQSLILRCWSCRSWVEDSFFKRVFQKHIFLLKKISSAIFDIFVLSSAVVFICFLSSNAFFFCFWATAKVSPKIAFSFSSVFWRMSSEALGSHHPQDQNSTSLMRHSASLRTERPDTERIRIVPST